MSAEDPCRTNEFRDYVDPLDEQPYVYEFPNDPFMSAGDMKHLSEAIRIGKAKMNGNLPYYGLPGR